MNRNTSHTHTHTHTCTMCVCLLTSVGAKYLENGWRYRLGYNGAPIENGIWGIEWSRDFDPIVGGWRCMHLAEVAVSDSLSSLF